MPIMLMKIKMVIEMKKKEMTWKLLTGCIWFASTSSFGRRILFTTKETDAWFKNQLIEETDALISKNQLIAIHSLSIHIFISWSKLMYAEPWPLIFSGSYHIIKSSYSHDLMITYYDDHILWWSYHHLLVSPGLPYSQDGGRGAEYLAHLVQYL